MLWIWNFIDRIRFEHFYCFLPPISRRVRRQHTHTVPAKGKQKSRITQDNEDTSICTCVSERATSTAFDALLLLLHRRLRTLLLLLVAVGRFIGLAERLKGWKEEANNARQALRGWGPGLNGARAGLPDRQKGWRTCRRTRRTADKPKWLQTNIGREIRVYCTLHTHIDTHTGGGSKMRNFNANNKDVKKSGEGDRILRYLL